MAADKKNKNTILKDALILFLITLISGGILSVVYEVTKEPIAKAEEKNKMEAYKAVFQDAETFDSDEALSDKVSDSESLISNDYQGVKINEAMYAKDKDGNNCGYVMSITSSNGYGGDITISLGIDSEGTVKGMEILSINETAGLGMKAKEDSFKSQFKEKKVEQFEYTKSGKTKDNEIDALSGATITTKAVTGAVNAGVYFFNNSLNK
ncbi:MAG: RnfABCDGE type electron transport complex subunit G [Lachnospiraceae bacterium]|nr:RnfABCDGE type electron transport complex subunit G [Lachnospiraceae bacterium]